MEEQEEGSRKSCFVIAPLGEDGSVVRVRSDKVFRHVIKPAVEECGYSPLRSDIEPRPGMIGQQIISHLLQDDLVIADLTGLNANVFYELAIRHMVSKPVVQIIQKGESLPFDITQSRTIFLDHTDLDSVERCRQEIITQIGELERDPSLVENPVSQAIRIETLSQSPDPKDRHDAKFLARLDRLSAQVEMLLLDRQCQRPEIGGSLANGPVVGRPADAVPGSSNANQPGPTPGSPFDRVGGMSVTLEQAVQALGHPQGAGDHPGTCGDSDPA
ncbi:MAG TPA: hypothetical protein VGR29_12055 [Thermomicrobiales bacterium]|nr:hypothetical protein [Thermomicrobiales bacterium]